MIGNKLFKDRQQVVKKVLQIGIGSGTRLRMWRDFFPNAKIYGADYMPSRLINEDRIESFLSDQRRKAHLLSLLEKIGSDIDLVIDNGSHRPRDQIFTCLTLMPLLKKGAIYIIEDVSDPAIVEKLNEYEVSLNNQLIIIKHREQIGISIFAKPAFLDVDPSQPFKYAGSPPKKGWLKRISSITRGEQIAEYIGAKLNPTVGYQNDICIYVKPPYKPGHDFLFEGKKSYLDICDAPGFYELLRKHPEVTVISSSESAHEILKGLLPDNKIVTIPEQHCNFERIWRTRKQITTVGCIGHPRAFTYLPEGLKAKLAERGMELIEFSRIFTRQDVIDFYMGIDIQIIWRPYYDRRKDALLNPLKIANASSFGVPTIAYAEENFEEMDGCYIPIHTQDEFFAELDKLSSDRKLYDQYAKRCIEKSEEYHIKKIGQLYKNLAYE